MCGLRDNKKSETKSKGRDLGRSCLGRSRGIIKIGEGEEREDLEGIREKKPLIEKKERSWSQR
jgi:hypothetical protein